MNYLKKFHSFKMRTAHSRFLDKIAVKKGASYDRVVTSVWSIDPSTKILTYGATIYRRAAPNDHWHKADHRSLAQQRFLLNPIRVQLQFSGDITTLSCISIDWYIADNLIFKFGTHDKQKNSNINEVFIANDFNEQYSLLTPYEEKSHISLFPKESVKTDWFNSACIIVGFICLTNGLILFYLH